MAGASVKIRDTDKGWRALKDRVLRLSRPGAFTLVGVQGSEAAAQHPGAPMTVVGVATTHEFGKVIHKKDGSEVVIPQRSFIRAAIDEHAGKLQSTATAVGRGVLLGKFSVHQALELLGQQATGIMKQRIADGLTPPNRPSTIARKGSSKPLIDTGQLRASITHKAEGA
jgi:phage gpG-like protein